MSKTLESLLTKLKQVGSKISRPVKIGLATLPLLTPVFGTLYAEEGPVRQEPAPIVQPTPEVEEEPRKEIIIPGETLKRVKLDTPWPDGWPHIMFKNYSMFNLGVDASVTLKTPPQLADFNGRTHTNIPLIPPQRNVYGYNFYSPFLHLGVEGGDQTDFFTPLEPEKLRGKAMIDFYNALFLFGVNYKFDQQTNNLADIDVMQGAFSARFGLATGFGELALIRWLVPKELGNKTFYTDKEAEFLYNKLEQAREIGRWTGHFSIGGGWERVIYNHTNAEIPTMKDGYFFYVILTDALNGILREASIRNEGTRTADNKMYEETHKYRIAIGTEKASIGFVCREKLSQNEAYNRFAVGSDLTCGPARLTITYEVPEKSKIFKGTDSEIKAELMLFFPFGYEDPYSPDSRARIRGSS